jgi:hypothetical protein
MDRQKASFFLSLSLSLLFRSQAEIEYKKNCLYSLIFTPFGYFPVILLLCLMALSAYIKFYDTHRERGGCVRVRERKMLG